MPRARWLDNVLVLHSLSKRSSAAGLRSGFAVGSRDVLAALNRVRLNGTACTPLPLLAAATALWSEDSHVEAMRERLRERKDTADRLLGGFAGYYRPPCGFFLWLRADDGVALTQRLWRDYALQGAAGRISDPTRCGRHQRGARVRADRPGPRPGHDPGRADAARRGPRRVPGAGGSGGMTIAGPSPSGGGGLKLARDTTFRAGYRRTSGRGT